MLKPINFRNSIRGENIQSNFEFLQGRIRSEALSSGGRGIIEGIEIEVIDNTKISVSPGRYINEIGDEIKFEGGKYWIKNFEPIQRELKALKVNALGQVLLPHKPYSSFFSAYFTTERYSYLYPTAELSIKGTSSLATTKAVRVENEIITLDASIWANREVDIDYLYARNRMDTVLLSKGEIIVMTGTMSPSISHIDLSDYPDAVIVGMLEINIDRVTTIKVHYTERQERPIYVDVDSILFLNGTEYRRVFFELPDTPKHYDIYIDVENNDIYSYIKVEGVLQWVKVNGKRAGIETVIKVIHPDNADFPADMQTFMFDKDEDLSYRFIPNRNEVEVIIDNAPLMSDQFEEIVIESEDLNNGYGIKLKDPLDRAAYVEIRVTHNTEDPSLNRAHQRSATFSKENIDYVLDETDALFEAAASYAAGEYQLEVYKDGQKVYRDLDYFETDVDGNQVPKGDFATHFKFAYDLITGEKIMSRVTKNIYSYDHISKILEGTFGPLRDLIDQVQGFTEYLQLALGEAEERLFQLETDNRKNIEELKRMDGFVTKVDVIAKDNIDERVISNIKRSAFEEVVPCESIVNIDDVKLNDFIMIFKITGNASTILIKDLDYTLESAYNDDLIIVLNDNVVDINANLLVKGVKFGI